MNPATTGDTIVSELTIAATPERIFDALVIPEQRMAWWGAGGPFKTEGVESDTRVGGAFSMRGNTGGRSWVVTGEYTEVDRPRALGFTWSPSFAPSAAATHVRFELIPQESGTLVRVTHSGLSPEAMSTHSGWPNILSQLRDFVS